jgi:transposase
VKGRKRHLLVDTLGLVWAVVVQSAGVQDHAGARQVIARLQENPEFWNRLEKVYADGAYDKGGLEAWLLEQLTAALEIVSRPKDAKGFVLLPKRWIVERTLAWISRSRRFSRDYEFLPEISEQLLLMAMSRLMVHRLAPS